MLTQCAPTSTHDQTGRSGSAPRPNLAPQPGLVWLTRPYATRLIFKPVQPTLLLVIELAISQTKPTRWILDRWLNQGLFRLFFFFFSLSIALSKPKLCAYRSLHFNYLLRRPSSELFHSMEINTCPNRLQIWRMPSRNKQPWWASSQGTSRCSPSQKRYPKAGQRQMTMIFSNDVKQVATKLTMNWRFWQCALSSQPLGEPFFPFSM